MAEILLLKRKHFAEDEKPGAWSIEKWNGRPLRGDVVAVHPNGWYEIWAINQAGKPWDKDAFMLVKLTNVNVSSLPGERSAFNQVTGVTHKNRYNIGVWDKIPWVKTSRMVNGVTVEEWFYQRSTAGAVAPITDKIG